jgi:hypothetical protein
MIDGQSSLVRLRTHWAGLRGMTIVGLIVCLMGSGGQVAAADGAKAKVDRILALEKTERPIAVCARLCHVNSVEPK